MMEILKISSLINLLQEMPNYRNYPYNGELIIQNRQGIQWTFYYRFGQIIWATGGTHPGRRFYRYVSQHFPQIEVNKIQLQIPDLARDYWDYIFFGKLSQQQSKSKQIETIVENVVAEILFDLAQQIYIAPLTYELKPEVTPKIPIISTSTQISLQQMQDSWNNWTTAGLTSISPNLAPVLCKPAQLQQEVSPAIYKNFVSIINGKYTLLDLAVRLKQNVLPFTQSLLPYIRKGITELIEVPDLPLPAMLRNNNPTNIPVNQQRIPLIACVDDSPQICKALERIITSHGLRFIGIQDPIQALPLLIQSQPDFIFIDLLMPGINGYELCKKLRKISTFSKTPLVILTSSNGSFDKVRSTVYGATYFINKPITTDKVMGILDKYLLAKKIGENINNLQLCSSNM
ncbi:response regulator [Tolypothrix sp. PCC 7910]|uniref:response regulator n=1 Tax=Tolypothrix sp. PCC 7910 TaxID=2099387 RepID=UPI001FCAC4F1|nr:response regulator [Tolypothrix sp. PCC 7910]